jgi:ABC-2 type transport system ATP-binding protein
MMSGSGRARVERAKRGAVMAERQDNERPKGPGEPNAPQEGGGTDRPAGDGVAGPATGPARSIYHDTMMVSRDEVARIAERAPEPASEKPSRDDLDEGSTTRIPVTAPSEETPAPATRPQRTETLVEVNGLRKAYGSIQAVDGIDFTVRRGDVLAFLGPNGAGKTTAMKMITGFLEPDAGTVKVAGFDVREQPLEVRRRIGYLPENAPAYGEMTVRGFLDFVAAVRELDDRARRLDRVVERTGLGAVLRQPIDTLSKGYKRRVGLAQALMHDPEVLILDEPTDGLDPNQKALVQELISNLSRDKSIVVSTHILDEAERICNRAIILSQGKIVVDSTPQQLMAQAPEHNRIYVRFEGHVPERVIGRVRDRPWCESAAIHEDGEMVIAPRDGRNHLTEVLVLLEELPVRDVRVHEGRLEDVFRKLTKGVAA